MLELQMEYTILAVRYVHHWPCKVKCDQR